MSTIIKHKEFTNHKVYKTEVAGRPLTIDVGKVAELATASAMVTYGETTVLVAVTVSPRPRDGVDFFPLSVDFEEKLYAVGRIPGSFMRREGQPSLPAVLASRVIDRSIRPLFPGDFRNDVVVTCTVMSVDRDCSPEAAAMVGVSACLAVSNIPWAGPIGCLEVGYVDGQIVMNPNQEQKHASQLDLTVAATGLNEGAAQAAGLEYETVVLSPLSHAGYYPGGMVMTMKVLYEKQTLRLLGAQIVGTDGVDKRLDVLATAMQGGLSVTALKELDLAYAPPYSSAKDPVNMAGFLAENLEAGLVRQFPWTQVDQLPRDGSANLVDIRTPEEYQEGNVPGFQNIPLDELRQRLGEIDKDKPVYLICQSGLRSYLACRILQQLGYTCSHLAGGFRFYGSVVLDRSASQRAYPCGMERP